MLSHRNGREPRQLGALEALFLQACASAAPLAMLSQLVLSRSRLLCESLARAAATSCSFSSAAAATATATSSATSTTTGKVSPALEALRHKLAAGEQQQQHPVAAPALPMGDASVLGGELGSVAHTSKRFGSYTRAAPSSVPRLACWCQGQRARWPHARCCLPLATSSPD